MGNRKYCVYRHTAPNGKVYVGVTSIVPERRWESGHGYKYNTHFWCAIVKYGWDNFIHEIVCDELTKEQAYSLEKELIATHRATDPRFGYNITEGGCGGLCGIQISEETRKKKSEAAKRCWETSERRACVRKGRRWSDEAKLSISETQKAVWADPVKRQKIIDGMRTGGQKQHRISVIQRTLLGEYVKTWPSMCEIERELGIPTGKISECCRGKRLSVKGFIWALAEVVE